MKKNNEKKFSKSKSSYKETKSKDKRNSRNFGSSEAVAEKDKLETVKGSNRSTYIGVNDPAWYDHSPQLVKDVASIPFNMTMGLPIQTSGSDFRIPGILSIEYVKTPGVGYTNSTPVNMAARDIYSYIRHANSGSRNYEAVDYMLYLLAMGEAYAYASYLRKILGCVNLYTAKNRFMPAGIYKAMGVKFDDIIGNVAQLRAYANTFIARLSALKVPSTMPIFKRWAWMDEYIFADHADLSNAQFYQFVPAMFRTYEEKASDQGGLLAPLPVGRYASREETLSTLIKNGEKILNKLLTSEDIGIMSGDTIKAFGDNVFTLEFISEDYTTPIIYDEEVLMTIQNSVAPGQVTDLTTFQIYQDPNEGTVKFVPKIFFDKDVKSCEIINMPHPNPTPMDVMLATRMRSYCPAKVSEDAADELTSCGSEFVIQYSIVEFNGTGSDFVLSVFDSSPIVSGDTIWALSTFSWHPIVRVDVTKPGPLGPLENVARLDPATLDRIHDAALLSLFCVPINMH